MSYKKWISIAVILFGIGLATGLTAPSDIAGLVAEDAAAIEEMAALLAALPKLSVFLLIFIKNVSAILISFVLSPIFLLAPVIALIINGWLLGWISTLVIQEKSVGYLLAGLLPHGIFELPALIIGEAVALNFGMVVMLALFKKERRERLLPDLKHNLRYLLIALALFLPAAIIETYITPLLLR